MGNSNQIVLIIRFRSDDSAELTTRFSAISSKSLQCKADSQDIEHPVAIAHPWDALNTADESLRESASPSCGAFNCVNESP